MYPTIGIYGGGSLGTVCAGVFMSQGFSVNLLTNRPNEWSKNIKVYDSFGNFFQGKLNIISDNPSKIIPVSDIILLCVPGFLIEKALISIKPYINYKHLVGSIVANTGFFFKAHEILNTDQKLFSFQRVPFISRYKKYGYSAELLGYKPVLNVAIENLLQTDVKDLLEKLFVTPIKFLNNFYEATLSNSNPILHTGRLFSLWHNYSGEIYKQPIHFYSDWTDDASMHVLSLDSEFIKLRDKLGISSQAIPSLLEYYNVKNDQELTKKIKSIPAFANILSPMKKVKDGFIPDFESRYFTEDFPYGLKFIKDLTEKYDINAVEIKTVYNWGISCLPSIKY